MRYLLLALAACHPHYSPDVRPRNVSCVVEPPGQRILPGQSFRVRVTVHNDGSSRLYAPIAIDPFSSDWIIDGRNRDDRDPKAVEAALAEGKSVQFSGASGDRSWTRNDFVVIEPHRSLTRTIDFDASLGDTVMTVDGVDVSDRATARKLIAEPGLHELQLRISQYEPDAMFGPDWDYELPFWEAPCNDITVEARR